MFAYLFLLSNSVIAPFSWMHVETMTLDICCVRLVIQVEVVYVSIGYKMCRSVLFSFWNEIEFYLYLTFWHFFMRIALRKEASFIH